MYLVPQSTFHLGTDQLKQMNIAILNMFKQIIKKRKLNINFYFDQLITTQYFNQVFDKSFDKVIFAVGRYGTDLMSMFTNNSSVVQSSNKVDIGIRFQLLSNNTNIAMLDETLYQWKIKYKTSNNMFVRTFCHNPKGYVVTQKVSVLGDTISIVNGHAKKNLKSNNTNFSILVTQQFTQPFKDSVLYGKIISQQANLLAGSSDRVILQTVGDFIKKKRTKKLFRVRPTLSEAKYVLGDLTYALPARTYQAIVQFLNQLSKVIPQILNDDNLIYGVQTKFYGMKMINSNKYSFIGDCSGRSRSIIAASCSGYLLSKKNNIQKLFV